MKVSVFEDYEQLSLKVAQAIIRLVLQKPNAVLCLATGDTPLGAYAQIVQQVKAKGTDFSKVHFVALDEWVGIPPENSGSCHFFLNKHLFEPLNIRAVQVHLFEGMSKDLQQECTKMDKIIAQLGGIDFVLAGIGMNGHLGFNEPDVPINRYAHVVDLDETTRSVGQKYFEGETILAQGITLGIQHLMEAKTMMMIANGSKKAAIVAQALEGPITPKVPASMLQKHANSMAFLDAEAVAKLAKTY